MLVLLMVQKSAPVEVGTFFPFYPIIYRVFFLISKKKVDFFFGIGISEAWNHESSSRCAAGGTLNLQLESSTLGSSIMSFDGSSSATLSLSVPATLTVTGAHLKGTRLLFLKQRCW